MLDLDDRGFILTGRDVPRDAPVVAPAQPVHEPLLLETSRPGVFAGGNVRSGAGRLGCRRRRDGDQARLGTPSRRP
jgi:thioredoxin reductase